jgi:N6-L-threonylcarbamoyladenine synthase
VALKDVDAIAVTEGPGLAGALLVGITYAKALALGLGKPLIAVNHLEGHIHAVLMEARQRSEAAMELPLLALVVSGGHTHLYLAEQRTDSAERERGSNPTSGEQPPDMGHPAVSMAPWRYRNVGRTVDDAAGEAFDKVAKLLGLGYPGGPWIDTLAAHGNPKAVPFQFGPIKTRAPREGVFNKKAPAVANVGPAFDFSFSGIKTAVLRYVQGHAMQERIEARRAALAAHPQMRSAEALGVPGLLEGEMLNLLASFQSAVVGNLMRQTFAAAEAYGARGIVVSGGVAANSELRRRFSEEAARRGLPVAFPSFALSTDNAAMIAAAAWPKFVAGDFAGEGWIATPQLKLG